MLGYVILLNHIIAFLAVEFDLAALLIVMSLPLALGKQATAAQWTLIFQLIAFFVKMAHKLLVSHFLIALVTLLIRTALEDGLVEEFL